MNRLLTIAMLAAALAGCGHKKAMLSTDTFVQAARDCHATGYSYRKADVAGGAPELRVIDTTVTVNGQQIDVARCVADKIAPYNYGHLSLQAAPNTVKDK